MKTVLPRVYIVKLVVLVVFVIQLLNFNAGFAAADPVTYAPLQGTITDENGLPIQGASLKVFASYANSHFPGPETASATTDQNGHYEIPEFHRSDFTNLVVLTVKGHPVMKDIGIGATTFDFQYDPAMIEKIEGTITLNGIAVPDHTVSVGFRVRSSWWIELGSDMTDSNGHYEIEYIATPHTALEIAVNTDPSFSSLSDVRIGNHASIEIPAPPHTIYGTVTGYFASAYYGLNAATVELSDGSVAYTNNIGAFVFFNKPDSNYTITVSADGYRSASIQAAASSAPLDIALNLVDMPPAVTAVASRPPDVDGGHLGAWYTDDVTVSFIAEDNDDTPVATISPPQIVSAEGGHYIHGSATDTAGNTGEADIFISVDKSPPVTTVSEITYEPYQPYAYVHFAASDTVSGVEEWTYYTVDGGPVKKTYRGDVHYAVIDGGPGAHILEFWSIDRAGHVEARNQMTVNIENKTAPITKYHLDPIFAVNSAGNQYISGFTLTLKAFGDPSGSGVKDTFYWINDGPSVKYTGPITIMAGQVHYVRYYSTSLSDIPGQQNSMNFVTGQFSGSGSF
ncbi:carboxypeptidase-like regulatory domain-containing protein [Paenibacillus sepulcri]|uniref:Carboxypeptidase-like regulatory domain-containing protein n=1 Tax=Paenibacillus sepulcri TaxID=359917 RepID=A0ABS7C3Q9_9BACL|nr:carboxypeptidase-like regulatory domain-containing protein [Paenibacillus sepulcri]